MANFKISFELNSTHGNQRNERLTDNFWSKINPLTKVKSFFSTFKHDCRENADLYRLIGINPKQLKGTVAEILITPVDSKKFVDIIKKHEGLIKNDQILFNHICKDLSELDQKGLESVLKRGLDPNFSNSDGMSLLHYAALNGNAVMLNTLLAQNSSSNVKRSDDMTPLLLACLNQHVDIAETLLKKGGEVNQPCLEDRITPLMFATAANNTQLIKLLLDHGANVNQACTNGGTALHMACANNNAQSAKLLIDKGALKRGGIEAWVDANLNDPEKKELVDILKSNNPRTSDFVDTALSRKKEKSVEDYLTSLYEDENFCSI